MVREDRDALIQSSLLEDSRRPCWPTWGAGRRSDRERLRGFTLLAGAEPGRSRPDGCHQRSRPGLRRIARLGPLRTGGAERRLPQSGLRAFFWSQYDGDEDDPEAWVPEELWPQPGECAERVYGGRRLLSHLVLRTLAARQVERAEEYMVEGDFGSSCPRALWLQGGWSERKSIWWKGLLSHLVRATLAARRVE